MGMQTQFTSVSLLSLDIGAISCTEHLQGQMENVFCSSCKYLLFFVQFGLELGWMEKQCAFFSLSVRHLHLPPPPSSRLNNVSEKDTSFYFTAGDLGYSQL